jgi:uncharacterized lipoprotein YajG
MKNVITILIGALLITSCSITKNVSTNVVEPNVISLTDSTEMSVSVVLPGDAEIPRNYESDTSHYNVFNITYKQTGITQVLVLPESWSVNDMVSVEKLDKIDTLQTKVLLIDVK